MLTKTIGAGSFYALIYPFLLSEVFRRVGYMETGYPRLQPLTSPAGSLITARGCLSMLVKVRHIAVAP